MKLQKIGLSGLISILAALTVSEFRFIPNSQFKIINSQALAQTQAQRKAEADRLLKQGRQQAQISQLQAALQSWQQALIIYREIKDRQSEGKSLGYLGIAYRNLGDYAKAIEYQQQACSRVGMEGFSTHSFRRTALTQMSNAGIPLRVIQKLSGHRAIAVTPEYLEVGAAQVRGAANSLSAFGYIRK